MKQALKLFMLPPTARGKGVMLYGRPAVVRPSTPISLDAISLCLF